MLKLRQRAAIVLGNQGDSGEQELLKKLENLQQSSASINLSLAQQLDKVLTATRKRYSLEE
eukprot:315333-Hanusia_phi.AAC.5